MLVVSAMGETTNNRLGILGGTFNPVHLGHLILAQSAMEYHDLAQVILMPCASPPHKPAPFLAADEHRMAMLRMATEDNLSLEVSDIEIARGGTSYTVDTVRMLKGLRPEAELFFIIGTDTLTELHQWKNVYELLSLCGFLTFGRPGFGVDTIRPEDLYLDDPWPERLLKKITAGRQVDISSSDVRYRVAEGMSIRYLVPPEVEMYIAEHGLYRG
jgi:nicotinate-nucleotide adenylyltransferase